MSVVHVLAGLGGIAPARDLAAAGVGAGLLRIASQNGEITRFRKGWYGLPSLSREVIEPVGDAIIRMCRGWRDAFVAFESALNRGRLAPQEVDRVRATHPLLRAADGRSDSGLESLLKLELLDAGIPFRQQVGVAGGVADFLIGQRLVIETDGRQFHDPLRDRQRDARFSIGGYRTMRFLSRQVTHEMGEVMASIHAAIARGDHG